MVLLGAKDINERRERAERSEYQTSAGMNLLEEDMDLGANDT